MRAELDHLILPVNDAAESVAFYTSVLGFHDEGVRPPFSLHLAFALPRQEFDVTFGRVRDAGLPFGDSFHEADNGRGPGEEAGARGPGKAVYLLDPNRRLIELRYYEDA